MRSGDGKAVTREEGYYWVRRFYIVEQYTGEPMVGFYDGFGGWQFVDNDNVWLDDGRVTVVSERLKPPLTED